MQMMACLAAGLVVWLAGAGEIHAKDTQALVISLDVPEERAPEWLCVIATESCRKESECLAAELSDLGLSRRGGWRYGFEAAAPSKKLPLPVDTALRALRRPLLGDDANLCSREDQNGCQPEVDLRQFRTAETPAYPSRLSGRVVCGARPGAESVQGVEVEPRSRKNKRVAFIGLTFGDPLKETSGIQEINFVGTTANVTFERPLSRSTVTFAQVVGGDYAPSEASAIGNRESVLVRLRPRCSRFVAEIPGHAAPVGAVSIRGESLDLRCRAPQLASRTLALEIPYTSTSEEKTLTVELATVPPSVSEARWIEALPPVPLKLGVRSLRFSWKRPIGCLAERWSEPTPAEDRTWSQSCPRATLSDSTVCEVISREPRSPEGELSACEYRCTVDPRFDVLALPIPVRFDRIRAKAAGARARTEIIYSWNDQIAFSGQSLTSTVAPIDRRVMLEFDNPFGWNDSWGHQLDALRIITGRSADQIDLTGRRLSTPLPRWISLATPGRTCSDRVRVTVLGTRRYDEKTFEVERGRIVLGRSLDFRARARGYIIGGGGLIDEKTRVRTALRPTLDLGIGFQKEIVGPWSVNAEVSGRLFWTTDPYGEDPGTDTVPFLQSELRIGMEWWIFRRYSVAVFAGAGLGGAAHAPARPSGRSLRFSLPVEVDPVILTMWPRRFWLLLGVGLRFHEDYVPPANNKRLEFQTESFMTLKLRGLIE